MFFAFFTDQKSYCGWLSFILLLIENSGKCFIGTMKKCLDIFAETAKLIGHTIYIDDDIKRI